MYNRVFLAGKIKEKAELQSTVNNINYVRFNLEVVNPNPFYGSNPISAVVPCTIWRQNAINFIQAEIKEDDLVLIEGKLRGQNNFLEVTTSNFQIIKNDQPFSSPKRQAPSQTEKNIPSKEEEKKESQKAKPQPKNKEEELGIDWGELEPNKKDDKE